MKKTFIFFIFSFLQPAQAQNTFQSEENYTPNGLLETVFDHYGNKFELKDVTIKPKQSISDPSKILEVPYCAPPEFLIFISKKVRVCNC